MKKFIFLVCFLPTISFADRLGSLKPSSDVLLSTQSASGGVSVYPATSTAFFPFSLYAASETIDTGGLALKGILNLTNGTASKMYFDPSQTGAILTLDVPSGFNFNGLSMTSQDTEYANFGSYSNTNPYFVIAVANTIGPSSVTRALFSGNGNTTFSDKNGNTTFSLNQSSNTSHVTLMAPKGVNTSTFTITSLTSQGCVGTDGSGNLIAGTCSGGGGGGSSLEVFSNFDSVRSSPTASIATGDALKLSVSGSTAIITVDFSSVTAQGNTFNGASQLLQLSASSLVPNANIDSSSITKQGQGVAVLIATQTFSGQETHISTGTSPAIKVTANGTYGTTNGTSGGFLVDCTGGGGASGMCAQIYSNAGAQTALGGLFNLITDNTLWNEPIEYIQDVGSASNGHPQLRIDAKNPNIEMINTTLGGTVKYELAVPASADYFQVNRRDAANSSFVDAVRIHGKGGVGANGNLGVNALQVMATGYLVLNDATDTNYVAFRASDTVSTKNVYIVPASSGAANTVIQTDGRNNLFFGAVSSFTATGVTAGSYTLSSITVDAQGRISAASNGSASGSVSGSTGTLGITIDGGGSAIISGSTRSITVPYGCSISSWTVLADASGSISVSVKKATFASYPTLTSMSSGGNPPSLTSAQKNAATPASWSSTSISQGDTISFVVDSASTVKWCNIVLWVIKT